MSEAQKRKKTPVRRMEKEAVKEAIIDVCAFYLGPPSKVLGRRAVWRCPECGKEKFEATDGRDGVGGCWNAGCPVPRSGDALTLIAHFEQLDNAREFKEVLAKGYEILGLENDPGAKASRKVSRPQAAPPPDPELADAVFTRLLTMCRPRRRDVEFWESRGVSGATVARGRFGAMTEVRAAAVLDRLGKDFGREALLSVPGFFVNGRGELSFTLKGDYVLIPYHDPEGRVTTLEGRAMTAEQEERVGKYVSLRNSGVHLYVFPGFAPDELEAFCEGPIGAIVAAQDGIKVGAIKGNRCHSTPGGEPLPEIRGADLGGRTVPYVPDLDERPATREQVLAEAPKAAHNLTVPVNGLPAVATLPEGKDLDEWLLSLPKEGRRAAFDELVASAEPVRFDAGENVRGLLPAPGTVPAGAPVRAAEEEPDDAAPVAEEIPERANRTEPSREAAPEPAEPEDGAEPVDETDPASTPGDGDDAAPADPALEDAGHIRAAEEPPADVPAQEAVAPRRREEARELFARVYGAVLGACPLEERHEHYWRSLGIDERVARAGRFASISQTRARTMVEMLLVPFGAEKLLTVPGFKRSASGRVVFELEGEFALVPYFDGSGRPTAIEAFSVADPSGGTSRVISSSQIDGGPLADDAGDHLYAHPLYPIEDAVAITEGVLEALRGVCAGHAVAAIRGPGRCSPAPGESDLPELDGVDFGGGAVLYAPALGAGEDGRAMNAAPVAAERLIERHGGRALVLREPPEGWPDDGEPGGPAGLGSWLLSMQPREREDRLEELFEEAAPLRSASREAGVGPPEPGLEPREEPPQATPKGTPRDPAFEKEMRKRPTAPTTAPILKGEVVLACVVSLLALLPACWVLGRLSALAALLSGPLARQAPLLADVLGPSLGRVLGPALAHPNLSGFLLAAFLGLAVLWRLSWRRRTIARLMNGHMQREAASRWKRFLESAAKALGKLYRAAANDARRGREARARKAAT